MYFLCWCGHIKCYTHAATEYFTATHPFSSFSCWYNSNLLSTELTLPTNSWCFLELATVMRLVHMVRSETGPAATLRQNNQLTGSCSYTDNYQCFPAIEMKNCLQSYKTLSGHEYSQQFGNDFFKTLRYFWGGFYSKQKAYDEDLNLLLSLEAEPPLWTGAASCWAALESLGNPWSPQTPVPLYPAIPLVFRCKT